MWEKMQGETCGGELAVRHCVTHQEMRRSKVLKTEHVMSTVT